MDALRSILTGWLSSLSLSDKERLLLLKGLKGRHSIGNVGKTDFTRILYIIKLKDLKNYYNSNSN